MIVMENYHNKISNDTRSLQILGFGLVKIMEANSGGKFEIILQRGIGIPLIQNVLELCKKEILDKKQGNSIIPLDEFMIYIHYFEDNQENISVIIYMDEKKSNLNYANLYLVSKKINKFFSSNKPISDVKTLCNTTIEIPRSEEIKAIFIINSSGSPYYTKISKIRTSIDKSQMHISAFISALFSFSKEVIGQESGAKLKEINFGNQRFYMITKNKVIFAYLIEKLNQLVQRYMYYLIVDEFLDKYQENIKNFAGDMSPFEDFDKVINHYFIL